MQEVILEQLLIDLSFMKFWHNVNRSWYLKSNNNKSTNFGPDRCS